MRQILGVFEVFLGIFKKTKKEKDRGIPRPLRGQKTSGPLSRVSPLLFRPSGRN